MTPRFTPEYYKSLIRHPHSWSSEIFIPNHHITSVSYASSATNFDWNLVCSIWHWRSPVHLWRWPALLLTWFRHKCTSITLWKSRPVLHSLDSPWKPLENRQGLPPHLGSLLRLPVHRQSQVSEWTFTGRGWICMCISLTTRFITHIPRQKKREATHIELILHHCDMHVAVPWHTSLQMNNTVTSQAPLDD